MTKENIATCTFMSALIWCFEFYLLNLIRDTIHAAHHGWNALYYFVTAIQFDYLYAQVEYAVEKMVELGIPCQYADDVESLVERLFC